MKRLGSIALVMLGLSAAPAAELPPLRAEPPSNILQFLHGIKDVRDRQNVVIRDAATLEKYWDARKGKPPAIDFAKNIVLLATFGDTPRHLNRAISITTVEKVASTGALRVQVVATEGEALPLSDETATTVYPYCAVVVEKPSGQVVWLSQRRQELKIRGDVKGFDGYPNEAAAVIRSVEAMKHYRAGSNEAAPKVDFERFTLLGAFRGKVPTTGYGIAIAAIRIVDGELTAVVSQTAPAGGAPMAPIPNNPAHVVAIDRWDGPVRFSVLRAGAAKPATPDGKDVRDVFLK